MMYVEIMLQQLYINLISVVLQIINSDCSKAFRKLSKFQAIFEYKRLRELENLKMQ